MSAVAAELLILALLIVLNGVLPMAEMGIVTARKARLERRAAAGDRKAQAALELANEPGHFLSTIQVGITLVGIFAGAFGGATLAGVIAEHLRAVPPLTPYATALGLGVVVLAITYLTLIFGELVPKRLALSGPERIALAVAIPMRTLSAVASPLVGFLSASTELVLRALGVRPSEEAPVTEEEIALLLAQGARAGVFETAEQDLVEAVFRLGDRRVSSLMTPRPEVIWLDISRPPRDLLQVVLDSHHVLFPVCEGAFDNVIGVVTAKDVLARQVVGEPLDLATIARKPLFVPASLQAFRLLELFKQQAEQFAIAIDEHGGVQGIVTLTDLLEAIVGEIPSAQAGVEPAAVQREDGSWLLDGLLPIEEVKELLTTGFRCSSPRRGAPRAAARRRALPPLWPMAPRRPPPRQRPSAPV